MAALDSDEESNLSQSEASELAEKTKSITIPHVTKEEQKQLERIIESLNLDKKSLRSLDQNGTRFLALFKHFMNSPNRMPENVSTISWREIAWAYHCQSQEILLDRVSQHYGGKVLWRSAREAGLFLWISDHTALVRRVNVLAFVRSY